MAASKASNKKVTSKFSSGHGDSLLSQLNQFRISEQFTDIVLICKELRIPAHKNLLAAASPYFMAMFSGNFPESAQKEVQLFDMNSHCLNVIVDFIYTGNLEIAEDYVQQLMETAVFLQMEHVADLCGEYMSYLLDAENCLGFKHFAEKHNNYILMDLAKDFLITHFQEVVKSEEFYEMSYQELSAILCHDELFVHSDNAVLAGLARWAEFKRDERLIHLGSLLRYIHPACVSAEVARSLPVLRHGDSKCLDWLRDVYHCEGNLEWHIFVLDKMGRQADFQRFDTTFEEITPLKPLPRPAFAVSLAAYKNILYVQGGSVGRSTRDSFYYNIYRDQWHNLSPLLVERSHHRSLVVNEYLYALGGHCTQGATCSVECLNLVTNKAVFKDNMLAKRSSLGAVTHDEIIYVMGGETDHRSLRSAERFDPRAGYWEELPSMREVNSYCSSAAIGDNIYCCEGLGSCMERFDLRANKWEVIDFWEEREFYEIFTVDEKLFSVFGEGISSYDIEANRWSNVYKFPESREWDTAVGIRMMIQINCD